jgi:acyl carrier protein
MTDKRAVENVIRAVLVDVLAIAPSRAAAFDDNTLLFGGIPELDSLGVASLLTEIEERLGIMIEDHEVDADMLESFGSLVAFAEQKTAG